MKRWLFLYTFLLPALATYAQPSIPGIRNTGLMASLHPMSGQSEAGQNPVFLHDKTSRVQLYPGFAVVRQTYLFRHAGTDSLLTSFGLPVEGWVHEPGIGRLFFTEPHAIRLSAAGQPQQSQVINQENIERASSTNRGDTTEYSRWYTWKLAVPPNTGLSITIDAVLRTSLSNFSRQGESRDGNAFALRLEEDKAWFTDSTKQIVMVSLQEGLKLTDLWGIRPDSAVEGDFTHLMYQRIGRNSTGVNFLVWYNGAPPDFKFDKKILPFTDTLYTIMGTFPAAEFNRSAFEPVDRDNFSLSPTGLTISGVLYFLMFTVPWIVLAVIIIYLLRGGKRKQASNT